ncbi:MAG: MCE family protein [Pararhodobacter sp.]|nr:MCE family protein [Pararhodobacter sp.]
MTDAPEMDVQPARKGFWRNLSPVWLVPILAVAVSVWIGWRSYVERGALIEIAFPSAAGVVPGETTVRLREVQVGHVESVVFSPDLTQVVVSARIDRAVADLLPPDAEFWVVRPEVSARGITGLTTVLSGVYIETAFIPQRDQTVERGLRSFTGRESAPLITPGREGTRISLRARDGNRLTPGAPVLHRGIEVGHIESPSLAEGAEGVVFDAFINAPHDQRITTATRFWDTSGFSVSLGTGGVRLGVGNLASILTGGIAFAEVQSGGAPLTQNTVFELYPDETSARRSSTLSDPGEALRIAAEFDDSVQGLTVGAEVRYRGVRVGEVAGIAARLVDMGPAPRVRMQALLSLEPRAFGLGAETGPEELESFIASQVAAGLRARMAPTGLFSTTLVIELVELPDSAPASLLRPEDSAAVIPSAPADLQDLTTSAQGLIERLGNLPIEDVLEQAIGVMAAVEALLADPGTRAAPGAAVALIDEARTLIGSPALQALPADVQGTVTELRTILAEFADARAAERLVATLESAQQVADGLAEATGEVPALITELRTLVARAAALEAEALIAAATRLIESADAFVSDEGTQALPPALASALGEVEAVLHDLRTGGVVESVNQTLASASSAAEAVALATQELPALAQRLDRLVAQAEGLVAAYGPRSPINDEALATLRDARATARAFAQLARAIERNPNSLLFGR